MATTRVGISGWRYAPWRGDFYPKGLAQKRELQFASRAVNSIEIEPDGSAAWVAAAGGNKRLIRIDLATNLVTGTVDLDPNEFPVLSLAMSPDGTTA